MSDDIVTRLRFLLGKCNTAPAMAVWSRELREAADEIERLRAERDEARREVCEILERDAGFAAQRQAASRGWNCYKADIA
jgi:hypothetical protein